MKKTAMTVLAAAGLVLSSMAVQPPAAHADGVGHVVCLVASDVFTLGLVQCPPDQFSGPPGSQETATPFSYSLQNVKVTATSNLHTYLFDIAPNDGTAASHFNGTYTVSTKVAHEDYGKAHWDFTCPFDPWTYPTSLVCSQPASLAGSSLAEPAGAEALGEDVDGGHEALAAALQKALAAAPKLAGQTIGQSEAALLSLPQPAATKPDLEAVAIGGYTTISNGDNAVYTATIHNNGAAATGNVEVVIGMSDALQAWDPIQQSIGLYCTQGSGKDVNTFTCEGGTLAAGQSATLTFRAHAATPGKGTIVVSLNSSRALDESNYGNDLATYPVTVTK